MTRKPRIAIDAEVLRALRAWAARDGKDPDTLMIEVLRAAIPPEVATFAKLRSSEGKKPLHPEPLREKASLQSEIPESLRSAPPEEKGRKARAWHGGRPPLEETHPELAARILAMWAGGKQRGGMSREKVSKLLRAEKLCPALECGHIGGRAVTRLTAIARDLVSFGNGPAKMA